MPTLAPLTPAHTLLAPLFLQPSHALESWLALGLHRPGQSEDGETDQTVFLTELAQDQSVHVMKLGQTGMILAARGVIQLMQHGSSPFVANSKGVDGFDLICWWENLELTRVLLSAPDRPEVDALMNRKPTVVLGKPKLMPPTQWAAWALQDRGEELHEAHLRGGHWPHDILGWAHPQLIENLLDWGAPWSKEVMPLWAQRARAGDLDIKNVARMRLRCVQRFGEAQVQDAPKTIRNGQDLVTYLQKNKADGWAEMREQAGDMRAWTVPYKDGQGQRGHWPLLGRLMALMVADKALAKTEEIIRFVTQEFDHLAGDPNQVLPHSEHTLGSLVHSVIPWLKNLHANCGINRRWGFPDISPLEDKVKTWASEISLEQMLLCSDAIHQGKLFVAGQTWKLAPFVNALLFERADHALMAHPEQKDRAPLVNWAIQRLTQPTTCAGFWDPDRLNSAVGEAVSKNLLRQLPFRHLEAALSPAERLRSLIAFALTSGAASNAKLVPHVVKEMEKVGQVDELRDLIALTGAGKSAALYPILNMRPRMEALLRELTTAPLAVPDHEASAERRRMKVRS